MAICPVSQLPTYSIRRIWSTKMLHGCHPTSFTDKLVKEFKSTVTIRSFLKSATNPIPSASHVAMRIGWSSLRPPVMEDSDRWTAPVTPSTEQILLTASESKPWQTSIRPELNRTEWCGLVSCEDSFNSLSSTPADVNSFTYCNSKQAAKVHSVNKLQCHTRPNELKDNILNINYLILRPAL